MRGAGENNKKKEKENIPYEYHDTLKIIQIFITFQVTTLILIVGTVLWIAFMIYIQVLKQKPHT